MRELDARSQDGYSVALLWRKRDNQLFVELTRQDSEPVLAAVPGEKALDAFFHPFVYVEDEEVTRVLGS